jgi:hypothetical protein
MARPTGHRTIAADLLTAIGRDGCFKRLAPRFPRAFGYRKTELLNQPFLLFIHAADRAATSMALEQLARGEPALGLERPSLSDNRPLAQTRA